MFSWIRIISLYFLDQNIFIDISGCIDYKRALRCSLIIFIFPLNKAFFKQQDSEAKQKELLRVCLLVWRPDNVVKGVDAGIDVFSGSYPYVLTQRYEAMTFDCKNPGNDDHNGSGDNANGDEDETSEPKRKKMKQEAVSATIKIDEFK
jgi:hypothetical protein